MKVRLERVQSVIGTFQCFDAVMLQECGMPSCGISFLNETEQTNETQTNFECFVQCALFLLQLDFCLFVSWRVQFLRKWLVEGF